MKFIADAMLGRLAKWLRMLGFDTIYIKDIRDKELVRIARLEGRTLLTRDTRLVKDHHLKNYTLLHSDDLSEQIEELNKTCQLEAISHQLKSRCANCNGVIREVPKETIVNEVPDYISLHFTSFQQCTKCGNVYWEGSHKADFNRKVNKLLRH